MKKLADTNNKNLNTTFQATENIKRFESNVIDFNASKEKLKQKKEALATLKNIEEAKSKVKW